MQIEILLLLHTCSLSRCITEIIPGHNVCKHSQESCLQNKSMYSYISKGQIDEILVWTKMKQRWTNGVLQVTRLSTHKTVVWRNGWHRSGISFNKIWDLPLETKVASVCTMYGRLVKDYVYSCSGLHQWSKLQLPRDESRVGILLYILENHRGLYWLSIQIISSILKLLSTDV